VRFVLLLRQRLRVFDRRTESERLSSTYGISIENRSQIHRGEPKGPKISKPPSGGVDPNTRRSRPCRPSSTVAAKPAAGEPGVRAQVLVVFWSFANSWRDVFKNGVADHAIKKLCRVYVSRSIKCEYCGN
jgi:hypothetical protein